jgi:Fe-S cluster biogenesis protein NfuA
VFLGRDFISVTKDANTDWVMLKSLIMAALMEHLATGQPVLLQEALAGKAASAPSSGEDDDEIVLQIKELLETRVRPAVAQDGGDIVFDRFEDGIVYLRMQGACSGCPSSTATLKSGVENMLRHFIPEVEEVRAVADY